MPIVTNNNGEKVYRALCDNPTRINDKRYLSEPEEISRQEIAATVTDEERQILTEAVQRLGVIKFSENTNLSITKAWSLHLFKATLAQAFGWREIAKMKRMLEERK